MLASECGWVVRAMVFLMMSVMILRGFGLSK